MIKFDMQCKMTRAGLEFFSTNLSRTNLFLKFLSDT